MLQCQRHGDRLQYFVAKSLPARRWESEAVIARLWQFGFSTKPSRYGFGLHYSANAAGELGATITAHSAGLGKGSRFVLRVPLEPAHRTLADASRVV